MARAEFDFRDCTVAASARLCGGVNVFFGTTVGADIDFCRHELLLIHQEPVCQNSIF